MFVHVYLYLYIDAVPCSLYIVSNDAFRDNFYFHCLPSSIPSTNSVHAPNFTLLWASDYVHALRALPYGCFYVSWYVNLTFLGCLILPRTSPFVHVRYMSLISRVNQVTFHCQRYLVLKASTSCFAAHNSRTTRIYQAFFISSPPPLS